MLTRNHDFLSISIQFVSEGLLLDSRQSTGSLMCAPFTNTILVKILGTYDKSKEKPCTGTVYLLQKCGGTSDTEERLSHGSMHRSWLDLEKPQICWVLLLFYRS